MFAKKVPQLVATGHEMLRVVGLAWDGQRFAKHAQLLIKSPLIRQQVFEALGMVFFEEKKQVLRQGLAIVRVVEWQIFDFVALAPQFLGEGPHGEEEADDFLDVMPGIVGLLPHLEEAIDDRIVYGLEP